jgi:hypothetical protein
MRSHISVHGATTKFCDNPFVFKNAIEKEGLPRDITPALGAGGPEFESRRPDQSILFVLHYLESEIFLLQLLWILAGRRSVFANHSISITSLHCAQARTQKGTSAIKKLLNSLSLKGCDRVGKEKTGGPFALLVHHSGSKTNRQSRVTKSSLLRRSRHCCLARLV